MTHQLSIQGFKLKSKYVYCVLEDIVHSHTTDLFQTGVTTITKWDNPFWCVFSRLSSTVSRLTWAHGWALRCEDYSQEPASLQTVHGVVWHQSQRRCFSRGAGRRQHGVRCGVHILRILHFLSTSLPVDVKSGYTRIGSQNVPLELWEKHMKKGTYFRFWVDWNACFFCPWHCDFSNMHAKFQHADAVMFWHTHIFFTFLG